MTGRGRVWARRAARAVAGIRRHVGNRTPLIRMFGPPATIHQVRESLATAFLSGQGIEIGALHQPLRVPASAAVKYVDRMSAADLHGQYAELANVTLVETDIIDDGETLRSFQDASQDFVIANHFLEHCQDPIRTLQNCFRVLKTRGVLYLAVPDKRFTFDVDRPSTTIEHLMRDFAEGPAWSKRQHYEEWSRLVNKTAVTEAQVAEESQHLINMGYSIHFHVWTAPELLDFVQTLKGLLQFEIEVFLRNGVETLLILRKA